MIDGEKIELLREKARIIREKIIKMTHAAGSGHPGGSLSCVEIMVALYFHEMRHDPRKPLWGERDRFILSKGHAAPTLYAILGCAGYNQGDDLMSLRKFGSPFQGHPDKNRVAGVDVSTGSLGQGLSISNGIAIALRLNKKKSNVYVLLGDGECNEGEIWEAAMFAPHYKIDNLVAIVDRNGLQIDGPTERVLSLEPLAKKFKSFGWHVVEIDGYDFREIIEAFEEAKRVKNKPTIIIAYTVKGRGVSFMEWSEKFHGSVTDEEQTKIAVNELKE
ncbi:MAG: transketolase [Candidatus Altiarchaeales archaeon WOR_SM1_86-2]|nr:MAG: transketolase [Candidatus Altiarchaeales archaeon WOR_SM1_86-2]